MIRIVLPIEPHAQKRPRVRVIPRWPKPFAQVYDHPDSEAWKKEAASHIRAALELPEERLPPLEGPVRVRILAVFSCPKAKQRKTTAVPRAWYGGLKDWDNIGKAVCDAGTQAELWKDDRLVKIGSVTGVFGAQGEDPHVIILVDQLPDAPPNCFVEFEDVAPADIRDGRHAQLTLGNGTER